MIFLMVLYGELLGSVPIYKVSILYRHLFKSGLSLVHKQFTKESTMLTTKTINYTINSEELFQVIARNNGITLTDIVKTVNPEFNFRDTPKTAYRHAIDMLVLQDRIRFTMKGKRRNEYFLNCKYVETSKRVIFANFIRDLKAAL